VLAEKKNAAYRQ